MATSPVPATDGATKPKRTRKPRSATSARPIYVILQVLDEDGNPTEFPKSRVRLVGFEKSADAVLAVTESNRTTFFIRGMLPVTAKKDEAAA